MKEKPECVVWREYGSDTWNVIAVGSVRERVKMRKKMRCDGYVVHMAGTLRPPNPDRLEREKKAHPTGRFDTGLCWCKEPCPGKYWKLRNYL